MEADTLNAPTHAGEPYVFGRVAYTHGLGIDRPLSVIRMQYSDSLSEPRTLYLHQNWRALFDTATVAGGEESRCVMIRRQEAEDPPTYDTTFHCLRTDFPAAYSHPTLTLRGQSLIGPVSWMGSLAREQRDATGIHYRRERFYDPKTARFTQEDPIGLAGGINLYGYASGDPVNFSDPFGLCPPENNDYSDCTAAQRLKIFGRNFVGGLGAMPGDQDTGPGWLAGARVGVLLGGLGRGVGLAARDASSAARVARGLGNVGGGATTIEEALTAATKWLGEGYNEIAPGVFRSADNARQFRMTASDLLDKTIGSHVHFEAIGPNGRTIIENSHVLIRGYQ